MDIDGFAKKVLDCSLDGMDLSGGDVHDLALSCGLIVETVYDPKKHGTDGLENCDPGDPWFVYSPAFKKMTRGA